MFFQLQFSSTRYNDLVSRLKYINALYSMRFHWILWSSEFMLAYRTEFSWNFHNLTEYIKCVYSLMWMIDEFTLHTHFLYGFFELHQTNKSTFLPHNYKFSPSFRWRRMYSYGGGNLFSIFVREWGKFYIYFILLSYSSFVYTETRRTDAIWLCFWMYAYAVCGGFERVAVSRIMLWCKCFPCMLINIKCFLRLSSNKRRRINYSKTKRLYSVPT